MRIKFNQKILLCLFFVSFLGASASLAQNSDKIIAVVNKHPITQSELEQHLNLIKFDAEIGRHSTALPPANLLKEQVLDQLIAMTLQRELAEKAGLTVENEEVEQALDRIAKKSYSVNVIVSRFTSMSEKAMRQLGEKIAKQHPEKKVSLSKEQLITILSHYHVTHYRQMVKDELLVNKLQQHLIASKIALSEEEIAHLTKEQWQKRRYHLQHFFMPVDETATKREWSDAYQRAKKMAASQLEDWGWHGVSELPLLFSNQLSRLTFGQMSEPLRAPNGYHLIKLIETDRPQKMRDEYRLRHILLRVRNEPEQTYQKIKNIHAQLVQGKAFKQLAERYSHDPASASLGGDLGWIHHGMMPASIEQAMTTLKQKMISPPIKTAAGWHVIEVTDHRSVPYDEQLEQAKQALLQEKFVAALEKWIRQLRQQAYIKRVNDPHG